MTFTERYAAHDHKIEIKIKIDWNWQWIEIGKDSFGTELQVSSGEHM